MKKAKTKPKRRPGRGKTEAVAGTVDAYIAGVPKPARTAFKALRAVIRSVVPAEAREVISYRIPAYRCRGMLLWFAAFSNHCSLFPAAAVIAAHKHELRDYSTSKGTVHFPLDRPLPTRLIKKLVKARIAANEDKRKK